MTLTEFCDHLRAIKEKLFIECHDYAKMDILDIADEFAFYCFMSEVEESEHTRALRYYLKHIHVDSGFYKFD